MIGFLLFCVFARSLWAQSSPEARAQAMLQRMNFTEKVNMLHGVNGIYVGNVPGNERLGIPSLNLQDGPQGFRITPGTGEVGTSTAWPSSMTIAASWDLDLLYEWAYEMAREFKDKGANVQLAPGIGIARVPNAGRNFEYLCGEDPSFGAAVVVPVIQGIQDQGVMADAKHWINNEIEDQRMTVSANVDERTRFELYYPPFEAAIKAGVLSVMCSYNRINDVWSCHNNETLRHLKENLGFRGFVVSDWTATHSTAQSMNAGLDMEMPLGLFYNEHTLSTAVDSGEVPMEKIDESVYRILLSMYSIGLFDHDSTGDPTANVTSDAHNALARKIAATSTVLVKNDHSLLPLAKSSLRRVVVIGDETTVSGTGSGHVEPAYIITPHQGISLALQGYNVEVEYVDGTDIEAAAELAADADVAIVVVATTCGEGSDRDTLALGNNQDALVSAVAAANPSTVVSVNTPGAVLMPWSNEVPAILVSWLPGQEAGNALADVIFGDVNPSARLHITMPNKDNEVAFTRAQYPGVGEPREASYSEELLIGYRYYDAMDITPRFCFGHGLSYTTFAYSNLIVEAYNETAGSVSVSLDVMNTGTRDGAEVVQLYLSFPTEAGEPLQQLKMFEKVLLRAQQSAKVIFELKNRDLSVWDASSSSWSVVRGAFVVKVGASSRDIRASADFIV